MSFFAGQYEIQTTLTPQEVEEKINAHIEPRLFFKPFFRGKIRKFEGEVLGTTFTLQQRPLANTYMTAGKLHGEICSEFGQTIVKVRQYKYSAGAIPMLLVALVFLIVQCVIICNFSSVRKKQRRITRSFWPGTDSNIFLFFCKIITAGGI